MSFWQAKTKIRKDDNLYGKYIRLLRGYKCEYCGRNCEHDKRYLDLSHYYGRRKESVRHDPDNTHLLCKKCHFKIEDEKQRKDEGDCRDGEYTVWLTDRLGKDFDALRAKANTPQKKDIELNCIIFKELIKELEMIKND